MSADTLIQWTDKTWNPVRGCALVSEGCRSCYAMKVAHRFSGPGKPYEGLTEIGPKGPRWNGKIRLVEKALLEPLRWRKPRRIFVNSMSDLFHEDVPFEFIDRVFAVMALCPQHTFQILTKRAERMLTYWAADRWNVVEQAVEIISDRRGDVAGRVIREQFETDLDKYPLPNVWLGVSVERQQEADERIPLLLQTSAAVRFISAEPLLGLIGLARHFPHVHGQRNDRFWVIVGGESGAGARPCDLAWIRSIVQQCATAGVSCFVKQLGAKPVETNPALGGLIGRTAYPLDPLRDRKGGDIDEWAVDLRIREFPAPRGEAREG